MTRSFRFRFVSEIAGAFVLLGVGLLVVGIYLAGHAQGWFEPKIVLRVQFDNAEGKGTFGLQEGGEVRILGTLAGMVGPIKPAENGSMETTLVLKGRFHPFVHSNSVAKVKKKFEVAGDAYVEITLGDPKSGLIENNAYIKCEQDVELIQAAQKMLDDVRATIVPIMEQIKQILANVNGITRSIDAGEGTAGRLISDKELAAQLQRTVQDLSRMAEKLPPIADQAATIMADARKTSGNIAESSVTLPEIMAQLNSVAADVKRISTGLTGEVANVHGVLLQTQDTLRETERLIAGLQNHWLIRDYVPPSGAERRLDPGMIHNGGANP